MSDPLEPYFTALGRFMHRYAMLEAGLARVLRVSSGMSQAKCKALFSGTRVSGAITFVRRIHEADDKELSPWLAKAFPKINELTKVRDQILHQGFALDGEQIIVSNKERNIPRNVIERPYKIKDLLDLEADSCVCHACINLYLIETRYPKRYASMIPRETQIAQTAWRYRPPQSLPAQDQTPKKD